MRDLCKEERLRMSWDDPVPGEIKEWFINLLEMLHEVRNLKFPRCIKPKGRKKDKLPELLGFGDGSCSAFCALIYIRWEMEDGTYKCVLVSGKTRVTPLKKISIPRIELLGAVAAVRLMTSVQEAMGLEIGIRFLFRDSTAVFGMLKKSSGAFWSLLAQGLEK